MNDFYKKNLLQKDCDESNNYYDIRLNNKQKMTTENNLDIK